MQVDFYRQNISCTAVLPVKFIKPLAGSPSPVSSTTTFTILNLNFTWKQGWVEADRSCVHILDVQSKSRIELLITNENREWTSIFFQLGQTHYKKTTFGKKLFFVSKCERNTITKKSRFLLRKEN